MILVFAANPRVFRTWVEDYDINTAHPGVKYVDREDQVRGHMDPYVLLLAGYANGAVWTQRMPGMLAQRNRDGQIKYITQRAAADLLNESMPRENKVLAPSALTKAQTKALQQSIMLFGAEAVTQEERAHFFGRHKTGRSQIKAKEAEVRAKELQEWVEGLKALLGKQA